jgi:hypothetical protein
MICLCSFSILFFFCSILCVPRMWVILLGLQQMFMFAFMHVKFVIFINFSSFGFTSQLLHGREYIYECTMDVRSFNFFWILDVFFFKWFVYLHLICSLHYINSPLPILNFQKSILREMNLLILRWHMFIYIYNC